MSDENISELELWNVSSAVNDPKYDIEELMKINTRMSFMLLPVLAYCLLTMLVGIVGNLTAIYIYGWKWQNTTTRVFLFSISVIDLSTCILMTPLEIYILTHFYYFPDAKFCRILRFINYVMNRASGLVFTVIAVDRYIRICHPYKRPLSIFGAKIACIKSIVVASGMSWPSLFIYGNQEVSVPLPDRKDKTVTGVICDVANAWHVTNYHKFYILYMWCEFTIFVLALSIIYARIGQVIKRRNRTWFSDIKISSKLGMQDSNVNVTKSFQRIVCQMNVAEREKKMDERSSIETNDRSTGAGACSNSVDGSIHKPSAIDEEPIKAILMKSLSSIHGRQFHTIPLKSICLPIVLTSVFAISFLPCLITMTIRDDFGPPLHPSLSSLQQILFNLFSRSYLVKNCTIPIVCVIYSAQCKNHVKQIFGIPTNERELNFSTDECKPVRSHTL